MIQTVAWNSTALLEQLNYDILYFFLEMYHL